MCVFFKDSHDRDYETIFRLSAKTDDFGIVEECPNIAPGLTLDGRYTVPIFDWLDPWERKLRYWWYVRKLNRGLRKLKRKRK